MNIFIRMVIFLFVASLALMQAAYAANMVDEAEDTLPAPTSYPPGFDAKPETVEPSPLPAKPLPAPPPAQAAPVPAPVLAPVPRPVQTTPPPVIPPSPAPAKTSQNPDQLAPDPAIAPVAPPAVVPYTPPASPTPVTTASIASDKPFRLAENGEYTGTLRYWHADWSWDGENNVNDLGSAPFFLITLNYRETDYTISGQVGYGSGWAQDLTRLDLALAVKWHEEAFSYGLGVRRMGYDSGFDDSSWSYLGPELHGTYENFFPDSSWTYHLNASVGYYVWSAEQNGLDADGSTFGYAADAGLGYFFDKTILRAGYRAQIVAEDDLFPQDEFMGPYTELELAF
jgi:hypothetical protein